MLFNKVFELSFFLFRKPFKFAKIYNELSVFGGFNIL